MPKNDLTCGFPESVPGIVIEKSDRPFFEVKYADEAFIVPQIGNRNSEGTYRYPDGKLALVSTCYVPKAASIHDVEGVKIAVLSYSWAINNYSNAEIVKNYPYITSILPDKDDENFDQKTVAKRGTLQAARLVLRPKVISNLTNDGSRKVIVTSFTMDMADINTSLVMWKYTKRLGYQKERGMTGW